jgi:signal recognition particle subunit SRP54
VFDALQERLSGALDGLRGRGRLDAAAVDATLSDIRLALLEADVNLTVVRGIVDRLRDRLVGADLAPGLDPKQHVIRAVDLELRAALGGEHVALDLAGRSPAVIVLAGLQGAGKTTVAGKLARHLAAKGRRPVLVACDLQRPAAVEQLRIVAAGAGVAVHAPVTEGDPVPVARDAVAGATLAGHDTVIIDTAGRLHVDDELLRQARAIVDVAHEHGGIVRTLFVIDAMVGQEAAAVARSFADVVGLDGVILSKLDGDARGGAALSVREVTGAPILFASVGERVEDLEAFHPDRMASRILGMGDVLTLIERAEQVQDLEAARDTEQALLDGTFGLDDLLAQLQAVKRMGPLSGIVGMLPGMGGARPDVDDRQLVRIEAIINSMTPGERRDPKVLNGRRRRRIAEGSGTSVPELNRLIKQFEQMQQLMRQAANASRPKGGKGGKKGKGGGKGRKGAQRAALQAQAAAFGGLAGPGAAAAVRSGKGVGPGGPGGAGGAGGGLGGFAGLRAADPPREDR